VVYLTGFVPFSSSKIFWKFPIFLKIACYIAKGENRKNEGKTDLKKASIEGFSLSTPEISPPAQSSLAFFFGDENQNGKSDYTRGVLSVIPFLECTAHIDHDQVVSVLFFYLFWRMGYGGKLELSYPV